MAVKGTAVEILHPLLLTKRCGKSPIRMRKVKLVALRSFEWDGQLTGDALAPRSSPLLEPRGCFFAYSVSLLLAPARWMTAPSFRPPSRVKGPSFCSESGCQITKRGNQKNFHFTQDLVWIAVRKTASPKGQGADSHMISVETSQLSCSSFF